ncbi:fermitin family homolog 2 isoform X1 [Octopus sinensis]|uniref:Fermitin family homolog 2 isoform X1 n=1 Tax=Octopus sinensis TaxID=2607531 RepID=A0A6P7S8W1_9MOLL|nr:fermitin family homolog 2 isoform X1 [Octopus sinensis]XP_029634636.1 fermitin family homolog 2 isoform X1 [Octopus sinensis]XP_029634638.1 fermitin family homolog 2 isoform X1 [Octopus sinensis]XP_036358486.1 fermitin family homolog 2 isoform X1 [Octopus sinensis]
MMSDNGYIDGSWQLNINVTDLNVDIALRVKGDLHIGGVMLQLVEALDIALDWSDHGIWWPARNKWLNRTRSTLDQYEVQADAKLEFTPMHKPLQIQLPNLSIIELPVDFSCNVFGAVLQICKKCGIRHPEELSLMRKLEKDDLKKNTLIPVQHKRHRQKQPMSPYVDSPNSHNNSSNSLDFYSPHSNRSPQSTLHHSPGSVHSLSSNSPQNTFNANNSYFAGSMHSLHLDGGYEQILLNGPHKPTKEAFNLLLRPKTFSEKARMNKGWLDSSISLMEQGIRERHLLLLRFKFFTFYDLSPKYDSVRINQIYEQAKWALISEEIDCTEEEMVMFAGLQLQVQLESQNPQPEIFDQTDGQEEDDIDSALKELKESLEGTTAPSSNDITNVPELDAFIKIFKPKKFTLKNFKRYYCVFREYTISLYKSKEDRAGEPIARIGTKGCEASPDVNLSSQKFGIKLFEPTKEGMSEIWLRFDTKELYCDWMAACRLASKGKTMADSTYESEVTTLKTFLSMQEPAADDSNVSSSGSVPDINVEDFVAPRFVRKLKAGQFLKRIKEAHTNVKNMNLTESKMAYIKAWQALPEYGITYFIIKMNNMKKEELIGVANNRIIRMDLQSGDSVKTWRYNTLQTWTVNWETRQVILKFEEENIVFDSPAADCKVVHEFIGGYIFLSMRSSDKNQTLDEALFHKLTGGRL